VLAGVAAACAWWVGRATAPTPDIAAIEMHPAPTPALPAGATPPSTPTPAVTATPDPAPTSLRAMRTALADVAPRLRACAAETGGLLIDFEVAQDGEQFTRVAVIGDHPQKIHDCVRDAVANLRFAPTPAQTFTEDYLP
jgi:hypothetical protein